MAVQVLSLTQDILVDFQGNSLTLRVTELEVAKGPAEPADPSALKEEEVRAVLVHHRFRPSLGPSWKRATLSYDATLLVSPAGPCRCRRFGSVGQGLPRRVEGCPVRDF